MKNIIIFITLILGTISSVQAQIPSYIPKDSLVGWWPFNGNANDESGNGNDGTVNGATLTTNRFEKANQSYLFDNVDYIDLKKQPTSGTNSFSIFGWVKTPNQFARREIISYGSNTAGKGAWLYVGTDDFLHFDLSYTPGATSTDSIGNNMWHFIGVTNESGKIQLYVDGKKSGQKISINIEILAGGKTIGSSIIHDNFYFQGKIDDIGIWNRALDSNEIKSMYNGSTANVQNKNSNSKIKVYPNPAKDHLVIDFGNYSSMAGYEINIFDVAGKSVYSSTINKSSETIDLNTWTGKGVYFLKIYDKINQQIENHKIVIQ
jgi:hypothetical protein